jgi:mevalonate kinase|tara:strand:- start:367 stop:1293 length:927 start_codon:yes stop_codon:yes gene_type:complete
MSSSLFYSKILLFGEYGILKNSRGISIPYHMYKGFLSLGDISNIKVKKSNDILIDFYKYLNSNTIKNKFNLKQFYSDIQSGLYFESSIPIGYGIGSSGALVAALYDKYFIKKVSILKNIETKNFFLLKNTFSIMESFFHGESSGLDPLNSYLNSPILINSKKEIINIKTLPENNNGNWGFFLIDSGISSNTENSVGQFLKAMKNKSFEKVFEDKFIDLNDKCVEFFIKGNYKNLEINIKKLSRIVFDNFKMVIPNKFYKVWERGLKSENYFLKLCGSGGGGFILGFSKDLKKTELLLNKYNFKIVYRF